MKIAGKLSRRDVVRSGLALSATTAASKIGAAERLVLSLGENTAPTGIAPRERFLLDHGWKFTFGNADDPARDLGFGVSPDEFTKSGSFHLSQAKFDDSNWRTVNLPHDWGVELPFVHDEKLRGRGYKPLGRSYPETSVGWYRRAFEIPATDLGRRITVEFDGVLHGAQVLFNGYMIGRNDNGYCSFSFDLTDFANYGGVNLLAVRVDVSYGDGWFYEGAGIYRHVWITKTAPVFLGQWDSYVRTELKGADAVLELGTAVKNTGRAETAAEVHWSILDAGGKAVASSTAPRRSVLAGGEESFTATAKLPAVALWSPGQPNLYRAVVTVVENGKTIDAEEVSFGVRTIRFDVDKGFYLNGAPLKIKGTCNHQDHAGVGAAMPDRLQAFRLGVLKEMGSNAVRTSHNMPTPEWVEACDRMGMMMLCETRLASSNPEGIAEYTTMVKRYRNSPAIILWSIGNEEGRLQSASEGERIAQRVIDLSHRLDPTRQCTEAVNSSYGKGLSPALDVEGLNYNLGQIDAYHAAHPAQPLVGTETASTVSTRGVYITDKLRNWVSAYDLNAPIWAELTETWWKFYATRPFLPGGFAWTGFDYRGEPTPYGWPSISSQFGIVDLCGFPKDNYFYYKSWWSKEPVLHLFPHWNWEERMGEPIAVWVHSNLDSVELLLNGKSLGSKKVEPLTHLEWSVPYHPGTLEARGSKDGKIVLTERRETTGKATALRLTADRSAIQADGEDLAMVTVEALDAQGRFVATANEFVQFKVSGEGVFLGAGNGDPNCQEPDKEPARSLFNGLAQVIVQSTRDSGAIRVEASLGGRAGAQTESVSVSVATRKATLRPSL